MRGLKVNPQLGLLEGLEAGRLLERRLAVTTNNLANVDTPGFKREALSFREVFMRKIGPRYQRIFKETTQRTIFEQGELEPTGNPLDLAIVGEGFFKVQTPQGIAYTRAGNFRIDRDRRLVTPEGYPVLANGAPVIVDPGLARGGLITLPTEKFLIYEDGTISVDGTTVARLDIVTFDDLSKLRKLGQNLFVAEGVREVPAEDFQLRQGYLEKSNVNPLTEIVSLIEIHREFEAVQKALKASDEATGRLIETASRT
ncbi:flagellar basal-body rod protein FlgF [Thermosulfurimonas dismutans]|uniref:Flagellar basal-body rod protein FlgF n=1 Tax=Thermosulfurimonas dismutans TaxID=999894 RepID=A0A179D433_9BACT|nr:flagellar basal-body rod protein FlgF [Thermosulfurimonas dismutans]OAQ20479.1 Flagellar basal-body rod protein FlgF [Thermosulfurimonas dismutans]